MPNPGETDENETPNLEPRSRRGRIEVQKTCMTGCVMLPTCILRVKPNISTYSLLFFFLGAWEGTPHTKVAEGGCYQKKREVAEGASHR